MLKAVIAGAIGEDAVMREAGNKKVINFTVAHNESYKKPDGEKVEKTVWVRCNLWSSSEKLRDALKKGKKVAVEGMPMATAYTNKEGEAKANLELNVRDVDFI